jgi:hypothetical protein
MELKEIGCMVWLHLADPETFLKIIEYQPKGRCSRTLLKMERLCFIMTITTQKGRRRIMIIINDLPK